MQRRWDQKERVHKTRGKEIDDTKAAVLCITRMRGAICSRPQWDAKVKRRVVGRCKGRACSLQRERCVWGGLGYCTWHGMCAREHGGVIMWQPVAAALAVAKLRLLLLGQLGMRYEGVCDGVGAWRLALAE